MSFRPAVLVLSSPEDEEFKWQSVGWIYLDNYEDLVTKACTIIGGAKSYGEVIKSLVENGFDVIEKKT